MKGKPGDVRVRKVDKEAHEKFNSIYCLRHCPKKTCTGTCGVQVDDSGKHIGPHTCWQCGHSWSATGD